MGRRTQQVQDEIYRTLVNAGQGRSELVDDDKVSRSDWIPANTPKE